MLNGLLINICDRIYFQWVKLTHLFPMYPFFTPWVEKGCIGNEWVKIQWWVKLLLFAKTVNGFQMESGAGLFYLAHALYRRVGKLLKNINKEGKRVYPLSELTTHIKIKKHCVKIVQIRSFLWSVFSCIRTKYGDLLRKS